MGSPSSYDVAVIGAGIIGLATARALQRRARVVIVEAERAVARHQTGHNSGVIHSGLYYHPGSLKARLCVAGRDAMFRFCEEEGIPHERCGKVVVATSPDEVPALDELERRGRANGLEALRRLDASGIRDHEPHATGVAGLHVPTTGIVDYRRVAERLAARLEESGASVRLRARARSVRRLPDGLVVRSSDGDVPCRFLVNCAGLQCDRVARRCGADPDVRIVPFRGEYYELVPARRHLVRNLVYPVPDPRFPFLGVHFTRRIDGGIEAGPNAVLAWRREGYRRGSLSPRDALGILAYAGFWRMARRHWRTGLAEVRRSWSRRAFVASLRALVPELDLDDVERAGAGVRAQAVARDGRLLDDFHIVPGERAIHVLNAPSPGATASLAIGEEIAGRALREFRIA